MVSDKLIPPSSNLKIYLVHPLILQPPTPDDNNLSLLSDRESFILKLNRFICFMSYKLGKIEYFVWGWKKLASH